MSYKTVYTCDFCGKEINYKLFTIRVSDGVESQFGNKIYHTCECCLNDVIVRKLFVNLI